MIYIKKSVSTLGGKANRRVGFTRNALPGSYFTRPSAWH